MSVIQICDLFWKNNRDEDGFEYAGIGLNHEYGLTDSYKLNYFPASANQTPITWLLQVDFKETLDFIISFTNKAVEKYRNSKYGLKDVKKITLHIDETEVQQYISNAIWGMHRGIVAPAVPYLLQSVHMALEKTLLKIAQSFDSSIVRNILISILINSKSASLTSLVCSVVLAYPDKFSDIALILFKTIELFHFDSIRQLNEFHVKFNSSIGYGLNKLNDILYTDERLITCKEEFRNTCLENICLNYQYFGVKNFSEEENIKYINSIYKIFDEYKADKIVSKEYGILLARMDRRNLAAKFSEHKDGGLFIEFTPKKLAEDLKKKSMTETDKEIVFSKAIKAGKRIYYVDVRKNKKDDMFLAITESKKIITGEGNAPSISFEKHKIFLYKEDFDKFINGLQEAIKFIEDNGNTPDTQDSENNIEDKSDEENVNASSDIKIDIEF